jgi:type I restriction enzyme M protein
VLTNRKEKDRKRKVQLIDARAFWVQMEKSLGNKRRRIGDPSDKAKDPDHIGEITKIFGNFRDGETRGFAEQDPITRQPIQRQRVVSKVFDNEDFGYSKITVERPLRLNFQASAERIARLEDESGFKNLATSAKKDPAIRQQEIEAGERRQDEIRAFLRTLGEELYKDRAAFLSHLRKSASSAARLSAQEQKAVLAALGERDETAEICRDAKGNAEPDAELRDTETVPLKESIEAYFQREVLPHVPDAWIDSSKTKVGYEIPLNRHFYRYEPPRPLEVVETDIKQLESEILELLREVTA